MILAVISHTEHYYDLNGEVLGWGPTITEINYLSKLFSKIYHLAPLHDLPVPNSALPYISKKIEYIPLKKSGGPRIKDKLKIFFHIPYNLNIIKKIIYDVDVVHFRAPTNIGVYFLPYISIFRINKFWVKYGGNWNEKKIPISYRFQRWILKNNFQNSIVTINGSLDLRKKHIKSFYNPCFSKSELLEAIKYSKNKNFFGKLNLTYVGAFIKNKGLNIFIDAVSKFSDLSWIDNIYIVGDGVENKYFKKKASKLNTKVIFTGWLNRTDLNEIYKKTHIQVIPSGTEGFPKVLAESLAYGAVPVITRFFAVEEFINSIKNNGVLIDRPDVNSFYQEIYKLNKDRTELMLMGKNVKNDLELFTYESYINNIKKNIFNNN